MSNVGPNDEWQEVTGPVVVSNGGQAPADYTRDFVSPEAEVWSLLPGDSVTIESHETRYFCNHSALHVAAIEDLGRRAHGT